MEKNEHILLEGLAKGEENAWRELFDRHYPYMCYIAAQYVHDDFLAETIASDVISHLWEVRESTKISKSLRYYLMQATRFRCMDYLNTKKEKTEQPFTVSVSDRFTDTIEGNRPIGILLEKELEKEIFSEIDKLPADTRKVFRKSRFDGLTYEQIAVEQGISINTVKYHIKKALSILRAKFEKYLPIILVTIVIS